MNLGSYFYVFENWEDLGCEKLCNKHPEDRALDTLESRSSVYFNTQVMRTNHRDFNLYRDALDNENLSFAYFEHWTLGNLNKYNMCTP